MRPDEVFPMRIEDIQWEEPSIWIPRGKTKKARRFVPMSNRMEELLRTWCGNRTEGWVFPSARSKSGHLTTIAKDFQAVRDRAGLRQEGRSVFGAAYLWHVHHGGDEEHLCCGRFHGSCGPEVDAAISAPGIGAIARRDQSAQSLQETSISTGGFRTWAQSWTHWHTCRLEMGTLYSRYLM